MIFSKSINFQYNLITYIINCIYQMSLLGRFYRVFTFGQSHSSHVGCVIEGFPSNFKVDLNQIQKQLNRRRPGQSVITTSRIEKDQVKCISGIENSMTLGSPICFIVANENTKKSDYEELKNIPRPGHADLTYLKKYGIKAQSGGGRSSARQTIGRVIAGALAKQFLLGLGMTFSAYVKQIYNISIPESINRELIQKKISTNEIEELGQIIELKNGKYANKDNSNRYFQYCKNSEKWLQQSQWSYNQQQIKQKVNLRCPHFQTSMQMLNQIKLFKSQKDSLGGIVQGCIYGLPLGLGQPCFDKLPALMSHAMLSIPATKGFQYGEGFQAAKMTGSAHNDKFDKNLKLKTNYSGGTLGGISTGETFYYKVAFKPVSSIGFPQQTHSFDGKPITLQTKGRHDPCVLPRAPPIVDNMAAIVIMDLWLAQNYKKMTK